MGGLNIVVFLHLNHFNGFSHYCISLVYDETRKKKSEDRQFTCFSNLPSATLQRG